jgi:predicted  nucleic acid-binding Zn-ribbon protein
MDDKKQQDKNKKQEKEIAELKRAINILQRQIVKLQAGYQRNADQNRRNSGEIQKLNQTIRRIQ